MANSPDVKASADVLLVPDVKGAEEELSKRRKEQTLRIRAKSETPSPTAETRKIFGSAPNPNTTTPSIVPNKLSNFIATVPTLASSAPVTPTTSVDRKHVMSLDENADLLENEKVRKQLLERKEIIIAQLRGERILEEVPDILGLIEMMDSPKREKKVKISSQQATFAKQLHGELDGELTYVEKELARLDNRGILRSQSDPTSLDGALTEEDKRKEEKRLKREEKEKQKEKRLTLKRDKEKLKEELKKEREQQKTLKRMSKRNPDAEDIAISEPVFVESKTLTADALMGTL
jgi:hypothetical protein